MKLTPLFASDRVFLDLDAGNKTATLTHICSEIAGSLEVSDADSVVRAILDREGIMSTGMGEGIAIPHARTDTVSQLVCAIGVKRDGIDYGSLDGEPSTLFVLTLTPTSAAAPHVQFMALISRALNTEGRARALAATTKDELLHALLHHDA